MDSVVGGKYGFINHGQITTRPLNNNESVMGLVITGASDTYRTTIQGGLLNSTDVWVGSGMIVLLLLAAWRTIGIAMPIVAGVFMPYALTGPKGLIRGDLGPQLQLHAGQTWPQVVGQLFPQGLAGGAAQTGVGGGGPLAQGGQQVGRQVEGGAYGGLRHRVYSEGCCTG